MLLHPLPKPHPSPELGLGWPHIEPGTPSDPEAEQPPRLLGPQSRQAELAKGLVRPAGPAQMCD